ncbi:superkiller protein 3 SKI3 [Coprinopsis cinerea okayama7|uniref:Superkiller protein 3 SKI3 n=1 Tax=Coprinopsis cinerea (strain Okayama-7 / 130 / ATCC MYA-4618 / FGSC 9003) TaxID=240176 RepID=D6RL87_COPC7|nr:superkiller protein 3 SKI3 [Coprinopsis cinerea okayama7\|eukprot:XP_002911689.1 superkiller protein 3 SKI3 [Coprinopsis cinerea okayama7\
MSSTKALLKSARDKLNKKDFAGARDAAERILDFEGANYTAHVFLALALLELGENERSEQVYKSAIELEPQQLLARQGLAKFYERTGNTGALLESLEELVKAYVKANDATKVAETLQRVLEIRRTEGSKPEARIRKAFLVQTLLLFLPNSPYYSLLSTLPPPDPTNPTSSTVFLTQSIIHDSLPTYEEIVEILEKEEETKTSKEFNARRMRLGAPKPDVIRRDVDREVCEASKLPELYDEILSHPKATDELRLSTESKLLRYKQKHLYSIPASDEKTKGKLLKELEELVQGAILLKRRDERTWCLFLDWQDYEDVADIDQGLLKTFVELFPENALSEVVRGYFWFHNIRLEEDEERDKEEGKEEVDTSETGLDTLLNAPTSTSDGVLPRRILSDAYLFIEDYENAAAIAKEALRKLDEVESSLGRTMKKTRMGLQVVLLTSLTHLFPPKHHIQAMELITQVLNFSPLNIKTLMAKGYILQARKEWADAQSCFDQVVEHSDDDALVLRAQEESAWCETLLGVGQSAIDKLKAVCKSLEGLAIENELDLARCLWRIGQSYWNLGGDERQHAFPNFIAALKKDPEYAAAFTSLGLHYADYASPPDPIRASKCFQKAFELDPRQTVAAQRLATGFADEQEWDLVEVIARRTIEGEGGLEAGMKAAIQAFQVALRAEPDDGNLWLRLGEAYSKAGRYVAAVKALERAHVLDEKDWLPQYFIAVSQAGVGLYAEAIQGFKALLEEHPLELGIIASLAQAHLQLGVVELNTGFRSRAESSFITVGELALKIIDAHPGFRGVAWKLITDAAYHLSRLSSFENFEGVKEVHDAFDKLLPGISEELGGEVNPKPEEPEASVEGRSMLRIAIRAAEYRIGLPSTSSTPDHSAWYDLGASVHLWALRTRKEDKLGPLVIKYFSKAVKHDPGNDKYWVALGLAYFTTTPRAAQHAFVKALEIDGKNAQTWATLGLLYLHHGDVDLAEEVLQRAQTLDPDCTVAWVGQAVAAELRGERAHADALFVHATTLDEILPEADYNTSYRLFSRPRVVSQSPAKVLDDLLPSYYLLTRYCSRRPHDAAGLHLFALVCERLGHVAFGRKLVQHAIEILERVYEHTEDPIVERQFMIANATLGRLNLAYGDPDASLPSFESVLALVQEDASKELKSKLEAQARLGVGIAQMMQTDFGSALATFQEAQRVAEEESACEVLKSQTSIVLAQVLWSLGEAEFREAAKTELLKCISEESTNLAAIKSLAAMGILSSDEGLVDAAVSEIVALPPDERIQLDSERNVDHLLIQYHLSRGELTQALKLAEKSLFCRPADQGRRNTLASLLLKADSPERALALLRQSEHSGGPSDEDGNLKLSLRPQSLAVKALAHARVNAIDEALRCAQKAIMLRPGGVTGWKVLAQVRQISIY